MSFIQITITHSKGHMQHVRGSQDCCIHCPWSAQATVDQHLCPGLLDTHRQIWLSLLWDQCSFLLGPGVHKVLFVSSQSLMETVTDFIFGGLQITADGDCSHEIKFLVLWEKNYDNLDSILKRRHYFANKGPSSQSYGFSSSHIWMWELDHKESWVPKNWKLMLLSCGVGEDSWESLGLQGDPTSPS